MKKKFLIVLICIALVLIIGMGAMVIYLHFFKEDVVPVLTFHNVFATKQVDKNSVDISVKKFEREIKYLHDHKYNSMSMDEFYEWKTKKRKFRRKNVLITFDDGTSNFYTNALPILEKYDMKASVFVIWYWPESSKQNDAYLNSNQIKDILKNHPKIDILSHSYGLHNKELGDSKDYDLYMKDIKKVKDVSNMDIKYYAYPFGHSNPNYIKALKDSNYKLAFTFGPYASASYDDDNYEVPRIGVFESTNEAKLKLKLFLEM